MEFTDQKQVWNDFPEQKIAWRFGEVLGVAWISTWFPQNPYQLPYPNFLPGLSLVKNQLTLQGTVKA